MGAPAKLRTAPPIDAPRGSVMSRTSGCAPTETAVAFTNLAALFGQTWSANPPAPT